MRTVIEHRGCVVVVAVGDQLQLGRADLDHETTDSSRRWAALPRADVRFALLVSSHSKPVREPASCDALVDPRHLGRRAAQIVTR